MSTEKTPVVKTTVEKTTKVKSKIMVHLGNKVVKGPADGPWDCPEDILGVLLEENAVEEIEVEKQAPAALSPEEEAILIKEIKKSMTVDEIEDELWNTHAVEYPDDALKDELVALLFTARRTAENGE